MSAKKQSISIFRILVAVSIVVLTTVIIFLIIEKSTLKTITRIIISPYSKVTCKTRGGSWVPPNESNVQYHCVIRYLDSGQDCVSNKQCQGGCIVGPFNDVKYDDNGYIIGKCEADNSPDCIYPTLETPTKTMPEGSVYCF